MLRIRPALYAIPIILTLLFLTSASRAGYERINAPNPADPMDVHIYRLDNGLTVYLTENHQTPRFFAAIAVRAGSKHDPAESTGLAHYLEHMLFKGTRNIGTLDYEEEKVHLDRITELYEQHFHQTDPEKRKAIYAEINRQSQLAAQYAIPNEIDKLYKGMGGTAVNAHTYHEETVYKVELPSNALHQWAVIESERLQNAVFRLFQPELEIVYEEKNRTLDSRRSIIHQAVGEALFKDHPYGQQPTIGTVEHLKNPSLKNMYWFYNTYYVPNNMAVLISGDIDIEETIRVVDEHFSAWKRKELPQSRIWEEAPLDRREHVITRYEGEEYVLLGFRTAPVNHPDAEAVVLLDMILDNRTAGLINLNLNQQQRVRRAGAYPYLFNDYGAELLWGVPKKGQSLEEVEQLLLEQVELIKKGAFEDWILPAIVTDFKKERKSHLETNGGSYSRVGMMRSAFLRYQDWDYAIARIDRMEKVTKEDVIRVARKYFGKNYIAGYRIDEQHEVPKIQKPQIDKIDIDPNRQSAFARKVMAMAVEPIKPTFVDPKRDYQRVDYHDGVPLYYARNPLNDLFSLSFSVDIGTNQNNKLGIAERLLSKSGTANTRSEELKKEWYRLGTDFGFSVGTNEATVTISGLDENFGPSLALMMDLLKNPAPDPATLEALIKIILGEREDARKNHREIGGGIVLYNRHGKESRYLRMLPNEEVQELTVEELHRIVRDFLGHKHRIRYTGSLPLETVLKTLKTHHPLSGALKEPPPYRFLKARAPEGTEIYFFHKEMAQSRVTIEFGDEDYNEARIPAANLYNEYFGGGMSGIVFQELRESRALAYGAWSRYYPGSRKDDQNLMWGRIECQTDKTPEAVEAFIDLIDNLPVASGRFGVAREAVLNRYRTYKLTFREVLGAVGSWERLGVEVDPRKARFEKTLNAQIDLVLQFHKARISGRPKLISVVGDSGKIDMARLRKIGRVVNVGLEDIFIF